MAKRRAPRGKKQAKRTTRGRSAKAAAKPSRKKRSVSRAKRAPKRKIAARGTPAKMARLNRERKILEDIIPTPPSSLDLDRRGSAARTGRAELAESLARHRTMTPAITGGDVDADLENAYFSGDEAPGGDMPTPDQDIVDDIGRAIGIEYQDSEELKSTEKVIQRDKHRWELDPASAEDYKERK